MNKEEKIYKAPPNMIEAWENLMRMEDTRVRNLRNVLLITGELDYNILDRSINQVIEQQEALRICFFEKNRELFVKLRNNNVTNLEIESLEENNVLKDQYIKYILDKTNKKFNFKDDVKLKCWLFKIVENRHVFVYSIPHIVSDGWSLSIIQRDIFENYLSFSKNNKLVKKHKQVNSFVAYIQKLNKGLIDNLEKNEINYWKKSLGNTLLKEDLPYDFIQHYPFEDLEKVDPNPAGKISLMISTEKIKEYSRFYGLSTSMLLLAVANLMLMFWCQKDEIISQLQVHGREAKTINMVGLFVNSVYFKFKSEKEWTVQTYFEKIKLKIFEILDHQWYPNTCVEKALGKKNYKTIFLNFLDPINSETVADKVRIEKVIIENKKETKSYFDFEITTETQKKVYQDSIKIDFIYNKERFKYNTISMVSNMFKLILYNSFEYRMCKMENFKKIIFEVMEHSYKI